LLNHASRASPVMLHNGAGSGIGSKYCIIPTHPTQLAVPKLREDRTGARRGRRGMAKAASPAHRARLRGRRALATAASGRRACI